MASRLQAICALFTACVVVLPSAVKGDDPSPANFRGVWDGTFSTAFGLADPNVADSWECIPNGVTTNISQTINITADGFSYIQSPSLSQVVTSGPASYLYPAVPNATTRGWAAYDENTEMMTLRFSATEVQCHLARVIGVGNDRQLLVLTIGGDAFTWQAQCLPANYRLPANVNTTITPFCDVPPGGGTSRIAYATNIVGRYTLRVPAPSPSPSPSIGSSPSPSSGSASGGGNATIEPASSSGATRTTAPSAYAIKSFLLGMCVAVVAAMVQVINY